MNWIGGDPGHTQVRIPPTGRYIVTVRQRCDTS